MLAIIPSFSKEFAKSKLADTHALYYNRPENMSKVKTSKKRNLAKGQSADWLQVAQLMLTSRHIDLIEESELAPSGKVNYQFSSKGHELGQILLGLQLRHPHDGATVYYRSRPFMLAVGLKTQEAFAADMALSGSPSEGRDVGVVYSLPPRDGPTVLPSSGAVGAQYTPAVGWAQAIRYYQEELKDNQWNQAIAVVLGGDGSVATSGFWAALTIASTQQLPMLFFIEDNGYGISVPSSIQTPGGDISKNLASFQGIKISSGSGTNPEECEQLIAEAVAHIRNGSGPALLRIRVPRLTGHTFGEDQSAYKSPAQLKREQKNDPLLQMQKFTGEKFDWDALSKKTNEQVRKALLAAEKNIAPELGSAHQHLFFDKPSRSLVPSAFNSPALDFNNIANEKGARINLSEAIRSTMDHELSINPHSIIFGEDVGIRGGVHRVTLDLQNKFGEARVFDTSLSEEGIIGRATGMALAGLRPIPEIQFRKYADPATEQINDLGWLRWRTAGKFEAPVVVRIPIGHSKKTGDPWHSVSGEAIYAHSLGWRIAMPSNAADAVGLLRSALRGHDPTLFLEHRALLDSPPGRRPYPGHDYALEFGRAKVIQNGKVLTVISWGEMLHRCVEAAQSINQSIEIIDLRTIIPWDQEMIMSSVQKTGRCLIVHEDAITAGFGGEIAALVGQECFVYLDAPVHRLATKDLPIPYNKALMDQVIPTVADIRQEMETLLQW